MRARELEEKLRRTGGNASGRERGTEKGAAKEAGQNPAVFPPNL